MSRIRRRLPESIKHHDAIEAVSVPATAPSIVSIGMTSSVQRMGALYALRMIEGARLHTQMLDRDSIRDHDLLTLCGLELAGRGSGLTVPFLAQAFAAQHKHLAARGGPRLRALDENIAKLGKSLRLKATECVMLRLAVVINRVQQFTGLFRLCIATPTQFFVVVRHATGERERAIAAALGTDSTLRRIGLLGDFDLNHHSHPLKMDSEIAIGLLLPDFDIQRVLRRLLRESPEPSLTLEDFSHLRDALLIQSYLAVAANTRQNGVNVLIHGAPGTGKTEFVRALAQSLKLRLCEVPVEDSQRRPVSGQARFRAFTMAQRLLERQTRQLLLFDEVEDVFGREEGFSLRALFGGKSRSPETLAKGWINETLESNPVPTVWVCNNIRAMDPAYLRRFDLVAEFHSPTQAVRRRIVEKHFGEDVLSPRGIEALAALDPLPPSQVARAARVVKALDAPETNERDEQAKRIVDMSLRAMGYSTKARHAPLPSHYDAALLNTDRDLAMLVDGLSADRPARLCLYGPPGTGKSALGAHLARVLDRPLHIKRASDLISMWVGETEKNIADAFREA
ncbi:MAG: ATP-binding protein, partial [Lysobacteraceae bacterium]